MIFANAWSIHRDSDEYYSPDEFIPERYLGNKFGTRGPEKDVPDAAEGRRTQYGFGAGRRVCSGQQMAENSLVSKLLCSMQ